jgi:hypothetical protein
MKFWSLSEPRSYALAISVIKGKIKVENKREAYEEDKVPVLEGRIGLTWPMNSVKSFKKCGSYKLPIERLAISVRHCNAAFLNIGTGKNWKFD